MEVTRRGPRMAPGKIRRGLHHLPPVSILILFFFFLIEFLFSVN